mmetsp:Transcript_19785/g.57400  ORF Transcript_19785/g.57400 Transcript_19785/m.57400 type:complete len:216 (-) Transcript_19785:1276-1923(-)
MRATLTGCALATGRRCTTRRPSTSSTSPRASWAPGVSPRCTGQACTADATPAFRSRCHAGTWSSTSTRMWTASCPGNRPRSTSPLWMASSSLTTSISRLLPARRGPWTPCSGTCWRLVRTISSRWASRRSTPTGTRTTAAAPSASTRTTGPRCRTSPKAAKTCRPSFRTASASSSTCAAPISWLTPRARRPSAPRTWRSTRSWTGRLTRSSSTSP